MATNLQALTDAVNLLGDAVKDSIAAASDSNAVSKTLEFENLVPDLFPLISQIGDLSTEMKNLQPADYITLVTQLASRMAIQNVHAEAIVAASIKLLTDLITTVLPDVQALIAAVKAPVAATAPVAPAPTPAS